MSKGCGHYEEALVERAAGRLRGPAARGLEAHLAECEACRTDLAVIQTVQRAMVPVPAGLEARVRTAVRDASQRNAAAVRSTPAGRRPRRIDWRAWAVPLAAAAMLAAVFVVGREGTPTATGTEASEEYAPYGALPGSDGFLAGDAVLSELTVEELERLLEEMES